MIKIRKFRKGDERAVARLVCQVYSKYNTKDCTKKGLIFYLENHSEKGDPGEVYRRYNGKISLVACESEKIIGFVKGSKNRIGNLFVSGMYHGKGIGKRLYNKFERRVRGLGSGYIKASSSVFAIPFYQGMGFKRTTGLRNIHGIKIQPMKKVLI